MDKKGKTQTPVKTQQPEKKPRKEEKEPRTKILLSVPLHIKEKVQQEAELAALYGWTPKPTVSALITWVVDYYLAEGIRSHIEKRRREQGQTPLEPEKAANNP